MAMRRSLVLLLAAVLALPAVELTPRFAAARTGDLLEWELRDPQAAWLDLDVRATPVLVVTAPDGTAIARPAFVWQQGRRAEGGPEEYEAVGARALRVRHTARVPGQHRWVLRDPAGSEVAAGAIEVAAGEGPPGPIRVSPHNARLLAFADGTPWIPIGPNIAWAAGPDRLAGFERYFAALAAAGGTHARIWLASWCGQFEGDAPYAYRLGQAWLLDGILDRARAHGLRLTLVIDNHHDLVHGKKFPYGETYVDRAQAFLMQPVKDRSEQYERKLRYLLARWGADDTVAVWELFNEVDMACMVREIALPWITAATALFARLDQDRRLATVSWAGRDWPRAAEAARGGIVQVHGYVLEWTMADEAERTAGRDGIGMLVADAERANQLSRPFLFGELGYQGTEDVNYGHDLDRQGLLLRQHAWAGFLLGGIGSGMNWWWDVYIDERGLWAQYRGLASAVARIDWRDRALLPLTPNPAGPLRVLGWRSPTQALLWPHPRADTWYAHFIEKRPRPVMGVPLRVTLGDFAPSTTFTVTRLDQVTGAEQATEQLTSGADGALVLTLPGDCLDLVLHVRAAP